MGSYADYHVFGFNPENCRPGFDPWKTGHQSYSDTKRDSFEEFCKHINKNEGLFSHEEDNDNINKVENNIKEDSHEIIKINNTMEDDNTEMSEVEKWIIVTDFMKGLRK